MSGDKLKELLSNMEPSLVFEEGAAWLNMHIEPDAWLPFAEKLRHHEQLYFDFLFSLTCIDWKTHLTMVYHLSSVRYRHSIVVKSKLDREKPEIESVSGIWKTAVFHEREASELFGVNFLHHPDPRLLILPEGWEGKFPLRKDFEDPVNMIRL